MVSYIYLIQDGGDIGTQIYKIGRTTQHKDWRGISRMKAYSKGTIIHFIACVSVESVIEIETVIIDKFKASYKLVRGREWFLGNVDSMIKDVQFITDKYKQNDMLQNYLADVEIDSQGEMEVSQIQEIKQEDPVQCSLHCKRCGHIFTSKSNLLQHLRRKTACPTNFDDISVNNYMKELLPEKQYNDKTYDCQYCKIATWCK